MIEAGADKNHCNHEGNTAFHIAATTDRLDSDVRLLDSGATADIFNHLGITALHCAAAKGFHKSLWALLSGGAQIDSQDHYGNTALHLAAFYNRIKNVKLLLAYGANPSPTDAKGNWALSVAFDKCHSDIVNLLLQPKLLDQYPNELLEFALSKTSEHDQPLIAEIIQQKISEKNSRALPIIGDVSPVGKMISSNP